MNLIKLLAVIAMLEGNPSGLPSDNNSTFGVYCISRASLHDYNQRNGTRLLPIHLLDREVSDAVALDHLKYLERKLGKHANVKTMAAAWNAGITGSRRGAGQAYGRRAEILYFE